MVLGKNFIGNQRAVNCLQKIVHKDTFCQPFIFSGPENLGKTTLALDLAAHLLNCDNNVIQNPDLLLIGFDDNKVGASVDDIRGMLSFLSLSAYGAGYKVVIIGNAHLMNKSATNALLKILEEPSNNTVMILLAADLSKILETIRSRCQVVTFNVVQEGLLQQHLQQLNLFNEKEVELATQVSCGRPGLALNFLYNTEQRVSVLSFREAFHKMRNSQDIVFKMQEAERLSELEIDQIDWVLNIFSLMLRQEMLSGLDNHQVLSAKNIITYINNVKSDIRANVNLKLVLENLYLNF